MSVEFDGVYRDATVYLNGHKLGTHPYGYTAFTFDLTPELNLRAQTCWRCAWTTRRSRTAAGTAGRASTGMFAWW